MGHLAHKTRYFVAFLAITMNIDYFIVFRCEHCQTLLPKWDRLAEQYKGKKRQIAVAKVK